MTIKADVLRDFYYRVLILWVQERRRRRSRPMR
jgi:hypothetical protein